ncbi:MAG: hypothetical protein AAFY64_07165, partial [Pseudomonadota bacterium]
TVLGDAVGARLTRDLRQELDRRRTAMVVQAGMRILPIDLLISEGLAEDGSALDGARDAWAAAAFVDAPEIGEQPTEDAVVSHARFIADADSRLLADMHAPILHRAYTTVFEIWCNNFDVLTRRPDPIPEARIAIARLTELMDGATRSSDVP